MRVFRVGGTRLAMIDEIKGRCNMLPVNPNRSKHFAASLFDYYNI